MALKHMATSESESEIASPGSSVDSTSLTGRAARAKELLGEILIILL